MEATWTILCIMWWVLALFCVSSIVVYTYVQLMYMHMAREDWKRENGIVDPEPFDKFIQEDDEDNGSIAIFAQFVDGEEESVDNDDETC